MSKIDNIHNPYQQALALEGKRNCPVCKTIKPLEEWYPNNLSRCKTCDRIRGKSKYQRKAAKHISSVENFLKYKLTNSYAKKTVEHTITHEDLISQYNKQDGKCYYSGRTLTIEMRTKCLDSLSIDRVDSTKGYTPDNIVLCCSIINIMKLNTPKTEFLKLCKDITDHQSQLECPTGLPA